MQDFRYPDRKTASRRDKIGCLTLLPNVQNVTRHFRYAWNIKAFLSIMRLGLTAFLHL